MSTELVRPTFSYSLITGYRTDNELDISLLYKMAYIFYIGTDNFRIV